MDIVKIGKVLQELRKKKGLPGTARTNGCYAQTVLDGNRQQPADLDILMELSDFSRRPSRICGERTRAYGQKITRRPYWSHDYSNDEKNGCPKAALIFIIGLLGFSVLAIQLLNLGSIDHTKLWDFDRTCIWHDYRRGNFTQKHAARIKRPDAGIKSCERPWLLNSPKKTRRAKIAILVVVLGACVILTDQCLIGFPYGLQLCCLFVLGYWSFLGSLSTKKICRIYRAEATTEYGIAAISETLLTCLNCRRSNRLLWGSRAVPVMTRNLTTTSTYTKSPFLKRPVWTF